MGFETVRPRLDSPCDDLGGSKVGNMGVIGDLDTVMGLASCTVADSSSSISSASSRGSEGSDDGDWGTRSVLMGSIGALRRDERGGGSLAVSASSGSSETALVLGSGSSSSTVVVAVGAMIDGSDGTGSEGFLRSWNENLDFRLGVVGDRGVVGVF